MYPFRLKYLRLKNRVFKVLVKLNAKINPDGIKVFLFHDVVSDASMVKNEFIISKSSFQKFITFQLSTGNKALSYKELSEAVSGNTKQKNNSFIITFDDAYQSVFIDAFPFLKKNNIPFIVFITVELIDKPDYLTSRQIVELSKDKLCTIGSHGFKHSVFRKLSSEEVEEELVKSKQYLETLINKPVEIFAFPYGHVITCSYKNIKQLKQSEYLFSFSAITGNLNQAWITSKYFLPRININEKIVETILQKK